MYKVIFKTSEIRGTWKVILGQLQRVGVQCIVDLFELHPFVKDHFRSILVQFSKVDHVGNHEIK